MQQQEASWPGAAVLLVPDQSCPDEDEGARDGEVQRAVAGLEFEFEITLCFAIAACTAIQTTMSASCRGFQKPVNRVHGG